MAASISPLPNTWTLSPPVIDPVAGKIRLTTGEAGSV